MQNWLQMELACTKKHMLPRFFDFGFEQRVTFINFS